MRYWIVYEQGEDGSWGAYAPDVPGCGAAAPTRREVGRLIREALADHLALILEDGEPLPEPSLEPWAEVVDIDVPRQAAGPVVG
jgi:predicted RNase H-like HicB family nuclease